MGQPPPSSAGARLGHEDAPPAVPAPLPPAAAAPGLSAADESVSTAVSTDPGLPRSTPYGSPASPEIAARLEAERKAVQAQLEAHHRHAGHLAYMAQVDADCEDRDARYAQRTAAFQAGHIAFVAQLDAEHRAFMAQLDAKHRAFMARLDAESQEREARLRPMLVRLLAYSSYSSIDHAVSSPKLSSCEGSGGPLSRTLVWPHC